MMPSRRRENAAHAVTLARRAFVPAALLMLCAGLSPHGTREARAQRQDNHPATMAGRAPGGNSSNSRAGATERSRPARRTLIKIRARSGDTVASLAERFNVSAESVAALNNFAPGAQLRKGQEVVMPSTASGGFTARGAGTIAANTNATPQGTNAPANNASVSAMAQPLAVPLIQYQGAQRLLLTDGTIIEAEEVYENAQGVWYTRRGVTHLIARGRVSAKEATGTNNRAEAGDEIRASKIVRTGARREAAAEESASHPVWIHLVGGARVMADEVTETESGAWYRHGNLSVYLDRSRIERIVRETNEAEAAPASVAASAPAPAAGWRERGWSTGNARVDALIRENGARHGVDPYLIFCVMEQESHFNGRALSPKGAQGLMQLMPGTAATFGVRNAFDPAQNISGGTRYLKKLLGQFGGRVDLALAGYNAGEGAVLKYGGNVPPYRETRNYVRLISARYGQPNSNAARAAAPPPASLTPNANPVPAAAKPTGNSATPSATSRLR